MRLAEHERERPLITLAADVAATEVAASPLAVAQRVDEQTLLVTVLDAAAARATRQLEALCDQVRLTPA